LLGLTRGEADHLRPWFAREDGGWGALLSVVAVLQIVPYFLAGFETVARCSQERAHAFDARRFTAVTLLAIAVGVLFYVTVILVVAALTPWQDLTRVQSPTLVAFDRAFGSPWLVNLILAGALCSLVKVYNGSFLAATRTLFGLASEGLAPAGLGHVHARFGVPARAILLLGLLSAVGCFFGKAALVPISEVASFCVLVGWFSACYACVRGAGGLPGGWRLSGLLGVAVTLTLAAMKLLPFIQGSLGRFEYAWLAAWLLLGGVLWLGRGRR
jgi:amino acid transporter